MLSTRKIVFLGETGVGKTSLVTRISSDQFHGFQAATIGAAFTSVTCKTAKLQIWDTAGQERYLSLAPMYYRAADLAVVVYSINNPDTLYRLNYWLRELNKHVTKPITVIVVGNKSDLKNNTCDLLRIKQSDMIRLAGTLETSARTGAGISELTDLMINAEITSLIDDESDSEDDHLTMNNSTKSVGCGC